MSILEVRRVVESRAREWVSTTRRRVGRPWGRAGGLDAAYLKSAERLAKRLTERGMDREGAVDRAFQTAMEVLTETAPPVVVRALKADASRMLREHRRLNAGFERRLRQRWGAPLDLYFMIAVSCQEIGADGYAAASEADLDENQRALLEAVSGLQARACRTAFEVHLLLETGFPMGALARARTLHELAVMACVLSKYAQSPGHEDLGARYLAFDHITNAMDADEHQAFAERLGHEPFSPEEIAEIHALRDEARRRFPDLDRKNGWAGRLPGVKKRSFDELEVLAGLDHLRPYYTWASHEVHAYPKGVRLNTITGPDGGAVKLSGRTNRGLADPAQAAIIALQQATAAMLTCPGVSSPSGVIGVQAVALLLDEACEEFARIEIEMDGSAPR